MLPPKSLGFINVATAGTPVPLSATPLVVNFFRVLPKKDAATENSGQVYLTNSLASTATPSGAVDNPTSIYAILAQEQAEGVELPPVKSEQYDLSEWYVDADNDGDGILVGYV